MKTREVWAVMSGLAALLVISLAAFVVHAQDSVAEDVMTLISASRTGGAIAIALAAVQLLTSLLKNFRLIKRIPVRWRAAVPIVLGGAAGILSNIIGGIPPAEAVWVGLFSGPGAIAGHEVITEAILGHSKSRHLPSRPKSV